MLRNSISVDMNVHAVKLKQKSTPGAFHGILQNFRTATLEINFLGLLLERKQEVEKDAQ